MIREVNKERPDWSELTEATVTQITTYRTVVSRKVSLLSLVQLVRAAEEHARCHFASQEQKARTAVGNGLLKLDSCKRE